MERPLRHAFLLGLALACATGPLAAAAPAGPPPDATDDPMLMTAGFLEHHQDIQYRMLGMTAYKDGRFDDALRFFRRAAFFADKPSQGMVAEMYWNGLGVSRDPVQAYIWMDLAAERGYLGFLSLRERYWKALTEAERARVPVEGQAVFARFGDAAAKPRYEHQLRIGLHNMTGSRTGFNRGVSIVMPGPDGGVAIPGSKFYDDRYWNAKKYWAWQDGIWRKPKIGRVTVGEIEAVSRIPDTKPETDAPVPEVEPPPH